MGDPKFMSLKKIKWLKVLSGTPSPSEKKEIKWLLLVIYQ